MEMERTVERDDRFKKSLISRLNRIEGQIRGIRGMIERDVYCDDILHQISAASSALEGVSRVVLESHIRGCCVHKIQKGEMEIIDELLATIKKLK